MPEAKPESAPEQQQQKTLLPFFLKVKYAFYSTLVFFLIANPETYKLTRYLAKTADPSGLPTSIGFFAHTLLFFAVMLALMMFPRD